MRHTREEVIERTVREFELLDGLLAGLGDEEWECRLPRPEGKDPWTVKDAVAHITHWKADVARAARRQPQPIEERGLNESDGNRLVYLRWHARPPQEVLAWHRQVQAEVLEMLKTVPEAWFSGRERRAEWPFDLDGHSAAHRVKDIERALAARIELKR
jgi:hypothetical protein